MKEIRLKNVRFCQQAITEVKESYFNSFTPEERRVWNDIERLLTIDDSPYNIDVILCGDEFVGFISWWQFADFCYVEHFAVEPICRGYGIGAGAISRFVESRTMPVVLEVELSESGEMARRRIQFYSRNGFVAHADFEYIQPSYGEGLPPVRLMLMTARASVDVDLEYMSRQLHKVVYGVNC